MSGILGLFNQDSAPVTATELTRMASLLTRRGPDRTGIWHAGAIGLVQTLLATTPELALEHQPFRHAESGCVISADVRLDNRPELLANLGIDAERAPRIGDAEVILTAYLTWGEACVEHLLGDFAFAIWDPRRQSLLCARDHFGMRPLYYHHTPGRFFAFASEPRAILVLPRVPYRINESRIADFLVSQLEGIDKTSSFFEEVYRLTPAHVLTVTPDAMKQRRYWTLEPGPELRLSSSEAYAEAFLEVFTEAVRCRLRSAGSVGSMLSGGMDSGSVVAVARGLLAEEGRGPLPTFSAVGPDSEHCVETRTIRAAITMEGLAPHLISYAELQPWLPELQELTWDADEPFDAQMTLVRTLYLAAHRRGIKVMLDGVAGDLVLGEGSYLARLLRRGRWRTAYREAVAQNRFWGGAYPAWRELYHAARSALVPHLVRRLAAPLRARQRLRREMPDSPICPRFAERIRLGERLESLGRHGSSGVSQSYSLERAQAIEHPYLTVGRERYDRVASAVAVEPRDPFLDLRLVDLCLSLPGEQRLADGWPKVVLRRAMAGRLPEAVRWRRGKEHLGWLFNTALMSRDGAPTGPSAPGNVAAGAPRVDDARFRACRPYVDPRSWGRAVDVSEVMALDRWLGVHASRPQSL
jgi:asparagine synthase (glutamine-hydrolysing)